MRATYSRPHGRPCSARMLSPARTLLVSRRRSNRRYLHPVMETVRVNGVDLAWESHGDGPDTLLLVHGFTGSSLDWIDVVPLLSPHVRVVTYDHRGHGESTNTGDIATYTFSQLE